MKVLTVIIILLVANCLIFSTDRTFADTRSDTLPLQHVWTYRQKFMEMTDTVKTNVYSRYYFRTEKRNAALMAVPSMYAISKGNREYAGEVYSRIYIKNNIIVKSVRQLDIGTIPHHNKVMSSLWKYLKPDIYNITIFDDHILSPLNVCNTKLYKYEMTDLTDNRSEIVFRPKRRNTQLVSGFAIVEKETGRIIRVRFKGEYDMVDFSVNVVMGEDGVRSLLPHTCDIYATFHFLGNKVSGSWHSVYDMPDCLPDSINDLHDIRIMDEIRPYTLPKRFNTVYSEYDSIRKKVDVERQNRENRRWNKVLWDIFGNYMINRTKGNFGTKSQGTFRISPILNPLYLSYSKHKGVSYKFKVRGSYNFSLNQDISLMFNAGYSFKQHQLYFKMPLRYTFNKKKGGFIEFEIRNGNRITNSDIVEQIKHETLDSINWNKMGLDYFKDFYFKMIYGYDLSEKLKFQPGFIFHRRSAVNKAGFILAQRPVRYRSFAPTLQLQFRPAGGKGPVITTDYERGIKTGGADMDYERFEFDLSWKKQFHSLKSLSMRFGSGFYTSKSVNSYFLDYVNFREENIPGGWNDDWTGEYQLLDSHWYNASEYYVRTNVTYESPLMLLSRIPYIGRLMEMERVYMNVLFVEHLHPYIEYGYGFTNRFFSMGFFVATRNKSYDGVGCRFTFELFRDW